MLYKITLFFLFYLFLAFCFVLPLSFDVKKVSPRSFVIDVFVDESELVLKDLIRVSIDSSIVDVVNFSIRGEAYNDYISSLNLYKKVYKRKFSVLVDLSHDLFSNEVGLFFSCFVVDNKSDKMRSFLKRLSFVGSYCVYNNDDNGFIRGDNSNDIGLETDLSRAEYNISLSVRMIFILFTIVLFLLFLFISIFEIIDILIIFISFLWFIFLNKFPSSLAFFVSALFSTLLSLFFFLMAKKSSHVLSTVRFFMGLAFSTSVIPFILKAVLNII